MCHKFGQEKLVFLVLQEYITGGRVKTLIINKNFMKNGKAVIYLRVSTKEMADKGTSVSNQEKMCREWAKAENIAIDSVYKDEWISWKKLENREWLQDALLAVQDNNSITHFLVTETDRFARNSGEHYLVKELLRKHNCKLIAVNQPYTQWEDETSDLVDWIMANINEFYTKFYWNKTKRHLQKKVEKWEYPRMAPLGYLNKNIWNKHSPHNVILINEDNSHLIQETFRLFATWNWNCKELNDHMYEKRGLLSKTGKKLCKSVFIDMLKNPAYYWMIMFKWKLYKWTHEPLIDKATYDSCQRVLEILNKWANRERKHWKTFFLTKFLKCWICGWKYTGEIHKKWNVEYYHCSQTKFKHSNKWQNVKIEVLEKHIANEFKKIQFTKPLMEKIVERAKDILKETHQGVDKEKKILQNKINALEKRRNNLETDRLDRVIDQDTYKRQHKAVTENIEREKTKIEELSENRDNNIDIFSTFMALTDNLYETYINAEVNLKKQLLSLFFDHFKVKDRKIISVKYTPIVSLLLDNRKLIIKGNWLGNC